MSYGYQSRLAVARVDSSSVPDHVTTLVFMRNRTFVLDTLAMNELPVPLDRHDTVVGSGAHEIRSCPAGRGWDIIWRTPAQRNEQNFHIVPSHGLSNAAEFYRRTQRSPKFTRFNDVCYARINTADGGVAVILGPFTIRISPEGNPRAASSPGQMLREDFHWSQEIIERLERTGAFG
jgi:hypothetical protein